MDVSKEKKRSRIGLLQLIASRIFSGLTKPALKLLITKGGPLGLQYPNSISFCNVLFVGNLCASIVPLISAKSILKELSQASFIDYVHLFLGIISAALYPSLIFYAFMHGGLINVVLILRFKGIAYAVFSYLIYKTIIPKSDLIGYAIIILGLSVLIFSDGIRHLGLTGLLAFIASLVSGVSDINDKKCLQSFSATSYLFLSNFFSAIIFFIIVVIFFGFSHFADAFRGELWVVMLVYAGIGIMLSSLLWFKGINDVKPVLVANVTLLSPIFTILFAYLILNEIPSIEQLIALAIIIVGLVVAKLTAKIDRVRIEEVPKSA